MATEEQAKQAKRQHSAQLLSAPGISGVGVEKDEKGDFHIAVHVVDDSAASSAAIPNALDGVPVRKIVAGRYRKL